MTKEKSTLNAEKEFCIGKLIRSIRKGNEISQEKLCRGLCNRIYLAKLENGEVMPDKLLVDAILERLGFSPDSYGFVFTAEEFDRFFHRSEIVRLLKEGNCQEAAGLLDEYEKMEKDGNYQNQIIRYLRCVLRLGKGASLDELAAEAEAALCLTLPGWNGRNTEEYLLSRTERALLALMALADCRSRERSDMGLALFSQLFSYMEEHIPDEEERIRQFPKQLIIFAGCCCELGRYSDLFLCEQGIELNRKLHKIDCLAPLLRYELAAWRKGGVTVPDGESEEAYEKALEVLDELEEQYGNGTDPYSDVPILASLVEQKVNGQILGEFLRKMRKSMGWTIEKICEEICDPVTVSRIERGVEKPKWETYRKLMRLYRQNGYRYYHYPFLKSDDYRVYLYWKKLNQYLDEFHYPKAEYELCRLERLLDLKDETNWQECERMHILLDWSSKRIDTGEALQRLGKLLAMTIPEGAALELWPFKCAEAKILNNMACLMEEEGKRAEGIRILEIVKKYYEDVGLEIKYNAGIYLLILYNLIGMLGRAGCYEDALKLVEEGIRFSYTERFGYNVTEFLYTRAWNFEKITESGDKRNQEACLKKYKQASYLANVMQFVLLKKYIKNKLDQPFQKLEELNV